MSELASSVASLPQTRNTHRYTHQHTRSDPSLPSLPTPSVEVTPPTSFRNLSTGLSPPPSTSLSLGHPLSRGGSIGSGRGRSRVRDRKTTASQSSSRETSADSHTSTDTSHSWRNLFSPRGWRSSPSREHVPVPREQSDAYLRTGMRVQYALKSVKDVTRIGLQVVADTGELIPVPGLPISNRFACLRLTGRCADFLLAITEEVHEREIKSPRNYIDYWVTHFIRAFRLILELMQGIRDQPFWRRFLDRDKIHADIETCHESLNDCMILFNISILTRILGNPVGTTPSILMSDNSHETHEAELTPVDDDSGLNQLHQFSSAAPFADDSALTDADRLQEHLRRFQERQNELDKAADMNDLRQLLSAALDANDDAEMQKSAASCLEGYAESNSYVAGSTSTSSAMRSTKQLPHTRAEKGNILDGEHIENETTLPSWTELIAGGSSPTSTRALGDTEPLLSKFLSGSTSVRPFFQRFDVWKSFRHPNILRLYGTSPYMRNGSLPEYLKRLEWDGSMIMVHCHEISQAMEYLHSMHVIHGDLKGANVLLDNDLRCVLADFGHSRHQAKISFKDPKPAHGFRWQSPELMSGRGFISKGNDVYAFAITCIEIVTMAPDDVVKTIVFGAKWAVRRFPSKIVDRLGVRSLLENCWHDEFGERPTFSKVVKDLETLLSPTPPPPQPQQMEGIGDSVLLPPASEDYTSPSRSNTIRPASARINQ
ncbi:hypothetical protein BDP27DRAFT_1323653 [Rhodocollybia butyracea]|uniref:Protein kinase domain-containing protein n=1 Tax=Rhodocollybia butyracea TaxID=206335 RepID=A0A9P5PQQ2_9AGAR|nr:hypothetical protein BDP27DRAFT_1323653 [Rhodocollybia butyracea]